MELQVGKIVKMDEDVVKKYHEKLIFNLAERGWAVYKAFSKKGFYYGFLTESDIKLCVESGRERNFLNPEFVYSILPYVDKDSSWTEVRDAMEKCVSSYRYPFFVSLLTYKEEDKNCTVATGSYVVDAISFCSEENEWELLIDYDLMHYIGIVSDNVGNIRLSCIHTDTISKQFAKSYRSTTT